MKIKYTYGSKRGKKLWINGYIPIGKDGINICIELNIVDNNNSINWINDRRNGKDNFIDSLKEIDNKDIITGALQYAENKGYLKTIKDKYNC